MYLLIVIYLCLLGSTQYKESTCVFLFVFVREYNIKKKSILVGLIHCTDLKEPSVDGKMVQADHTDARRVNN